MTDTTDQGEDRRARFRSAVGGLATRARTAELTRWVIVPGCAFVVLGFAFLLFGWLGAAHTARQIEQIPYLISGGLVGIALVFLGGLLLVSAFWLAMLQRVHDDAEARAARQLDAIETRLAAPGSTPTVQTPDGATATPRGRRPRSATSSTTRPVERARRVSDRPS
jgi:hypothetical protein